MMSVIRRTDTITATTDHEKCILTMPGEPQITIYRPKTVGIQEWEEFWAPTFEYGKE